MREDASQPAAVSLFAPPQRRPISRDGIVPSSSAAVLHTYRFPPSQFNFAPTSRFRESICMRDVQFPDADRLEQRNCNINHRDFRSIHPSASKLCVFKTFACPIFAPIHRANERVALRAVGGSNLQRSIPWSGPSDLPSSPTFFGG